MAATDSRPVPLKGVAFRLPIYIEDPDGEPVEAFTTPVSEVSKDNSAYAACDNEATFVGHGGGYVDLTAAEMAADLVTYHLECEEGVFHVDIAPAEAGDIRADDRSGNALALASGVTLVDGAITADKIATGAIAAAKIANDALLAIANKVESEIIDDTDSEKVLTAITDKIASVNPSLGGLTVAAIASAVWSAAQRRLTDATNITSTGGTTVPQTGDSFARLGAPTLATIAADIAARLAAASYTVPPTAVQIRQEIDSNSTQLQAALARLPAALVSGKMDSSVSGAALTSLVDAVWAKAMSDLATLPGATASVLAGVNALFQETFNRRRQTSGDRHTYMADNTTQCWTREIDPQTAAIEELKAG